MQHIHINPHPKEIEIVDFSVLTLSAAIASGELSSEALVTECLARIARLNPTINAFSQVYEESALEEALAPATVRLRKATSAGRFMAFPWASKDLFFVGWPAVPAWLQRLQEFRSQGDGADRPADD